MNSNTTAADAGMSDGPAPAPAPAPAAQAKVIDQTRVVPGRGTLSSSVSFLGHRVDELKSGLQKYIRLGMESQALYCALELYRFHLVALDTERPCSKNAKKLVSNLLNRLLVIVSEDVCLGDPGLAGDAMEYYLRAGGDKMRQEALPALIHWVRRMCQAPKTRMLSDLGAVYWRPAKAEWVRRQPGLGQRYYGKLATMSNAQLQELIGKRESADMPGRQRFAAFWKHTLFDLLHRYNLVDQAERLLCLIELKSDLAFYWCARDFVETQRQLRGMGDRRKKPAYLVFMLVEHYLRHRMGGQWTRPVGGLQMMFTGRSGNRESQLFVYHALAYAVWRDKLGPKPLLDPRDDSEKPDPKLAQLWDQHLKRTKPMQLDGFCIDKHTKRGRAAGCSVVDFAREGSKVRNECKRMVVPEYRQIYQEQYERQCGTVILQHHPWTNFGPIRNWPNYRDLDQPLVIDQPDEPEEPARKKRKKAKKPALKPVAAPDPTEVEPSPFADSEEEQEYVEMMVAQYDYAVEENARQLSGVFPPPVPGSGPGRDTFGITVVIDDLSPIRVEVPLVRTTPKYIKSAVPQARFMVLESTPEGEKWITSPVSSIDMSQLYNKGFEPKLEPSTPVYELPMPLEGDRILRIRTHAYAPSCPKPSSKRKTSKKAKSIPKPAPAPSILSQITITESQEFEHPQRIQVLTSRSKPDTYFALERATGTSVFVKGPYLTLEALQFQLDLNNRWKQEYCGISRVFSMEVRWRVPEPNFVGGRPNPEGFGTRTKVQPGRAYPFLVCTNLLHPTRKLPYRERTYGKQGKCWPADTPLADTSGQGGAVHVNLYQMDSIYMASSEIALLTAILFRYVWRVTDTCERNLLWDLGSNQVFSVDEESHGGPEQDRWLFKKPLGKAPAAALRTLLNRHWKSLEDVYLQRWWPVKGQPDWVEDNIHRLIREGLKGVLQRV